MLVCVAYAYVAALRGEKFQKKKASISLYLLLPAMGFRQRAGLDSCSLNTEAQSVFGGGRENLSDW